MKKTLLVIGIILGILITINVIYFYVMSTPRIPNPRIPVVAPDNPLSKPWVQP